MISIIKRTTLLVTVFLMLGIPQVGHTYSDVGISVEYYMVSSGSAGTLPSASCPPFSGSRISAILSCLSVWESSFSGIDSYTRTSKPIQGSVAYDFTYPGSTIKRGGYIIYDQSEGCPTSYDFTFDNVANKYFCKKTFVRTQNREATPKSCPNNGTNPIGTNSGNKYQREVDYIGIGIFPLKFERHYNSTLTEDNILGNNWGHNYYKRIETGGLVGLIKQNDLHKTMTSIDPLFNEILDLYTLDPNNMNVRIKMHRPDGSVYYYFNRYNPITNNTENFEWDGPVDIKNHLETVFDGLSNKITGYRYITKLEVESYDLDGRLLTITNRQGLEQVLSYNANGLLDKVSDPVGNTLVFSYLDGKLSSIDTSDGRHWGYTLNSIGNLSKVVNPDSTIRTYHYDNVVLPNALTGITDERGLRYANFEYGEGVLQYYGAAIASYHGAETKVLSDRIDGRTLDFNSVPGFASGVTVIKQSNGTTSQYNCKRKTTNSIATI